MADIPFLWSKSDNVSGAGTSYQYITLDSVQAVVLNYLPTNAILTSAKLRVKASFSGGFAAQVYLSSGYSTGVGTVTNRYINNVRISQSQGTYSSGNILSTLFSSYTYPFTLNRQGCSYLTTSIGSDNWVSRTHSTDEVAFEVEYTLHDHSYTSTITVNPTCTTTGVKTFTCSCGRDSYTESITALGHNFVASSVVSPSGNNAGYTVYTCTNGCGGSYHSDYTNSISAKAGTGCSYISLDGWSVVYEGETMSHILAQGSNFTLWSDPKEGYEFDRWNIVNADGSVSTSTEQNLPVTLNNNVSVEAIYKRITYTATFLNGDGSVLETVTVAHGDTPACSKTPTKAEDETYSYTWNAANPWTPAIGALTANQTYTPNFISTKIWYNITLIDKDGNSSVVPYRNGSTLTLTAPEIEGYNFVGWDDGSDGTVDSTEVNRTLTVTGDAAYKVVYEKKKYNITFKISQKDTEPLDVITVEHGDKLPYIPEGPEFPEDELYTYEFGGWVDLKVGSFLTLDTQFTGEVVYTAYYIATRKPPKFTEVKMLYQNKQISEENKVLAGEYFRIVVGVQ